MNRPLASPSLARRLAGWAGLAIALGLLILALHGRSLSYGLFMDDYAHFAQLREAGWSLGDLVQACRLELVGGVIDLWWMPETTLRFFRPVAFAVMKLTYVVTGWNPMALHAASLAWHTLNCLLLVVVLSRLGLPRVLAAVAAGLFAMHPAHVASVQWIASQTELMVTAALLGATWSWLVFRSAQTRCIAWTAGALTAALYVAALGCRENAIMLPVLIAAIEFLLPRAPRRRSFLMLGVLGAASVAYLLIRDHYLGGLSLPRRPYVFPPGDPGFVAYVFDKACYYLLGEFALLPIVPIGGLPYLREHSLAFYGATAALLAGLIGLAIAAQRRGLPGARLAWIGPLWLGLFACPVLPAFESPHHLYLPGVGWAACIGAGLAWFSAPRRSKDDAERVRWTPVVLFGGVNAVVLAGTTYFMGLCFDVAQQVEDRVIEEVVAVEPPLESGETLYFCNLPMIAHYVRLAVEQRTGLHDLRAVGLTWSPRILGPATPIELNWRDSRTLEVRIAGDAYFAGPIGRLTREALRSEFPPPAGERRVAGDLRVEVPDADESGIRALRFELPTMLEGRVFWTSRTRWAALVTPFGESTALAQP